MRSTVLHLAHITQIFLQIYPLHKVAERNFTPFAQSFIYILILLSYSVEKEEREADARQGYAEPVDVHAENLHARPEDLHLWIDCWLD